MGEMVAVSKKILGPKIGVKNSKMQNRCEKAQVNKFRKKKSVNKNPKKLTKIQKSEIFLQFP